MPETRVEQPIQFAVVLAGKYDFEEQMRDGLTIRVATYALKNASAMKQLADLAFSIVEYAGAATRGVHHERGL